MPRGTGWPGASPSQVLTLSRPRRRSGQRAPMSSAPMHPTSRPQTPNTTCRSTVGPPDDPRHRQQARPIRSWRPTVAACRAGLPRGRRVGPATRRLLRLCRTAARGRIPTSVRHEPSLRARLPACPANEQAERAPTASPPSLRPLAPWPIAAHCRREKQSRPSAPRQIPVMQPRDAPGELASRSRPCRGKGQRQYCQARASKTAKNDTSLAPDREPEP